jgi:hypothetical protein
LGLGAGFAIVFLTLWRVAISVVSTALERLLSDEDDFWLRAVHDTDAFGAVLAMVDILLWNCWLTTLQLTLGAIVDQRRDFVRIYTRDTCRHLTLL